MALCRGQALDILRWLGERRTPFTGEEFAEALEFDRRTAARWLADLYDRHLVEFVGFDRQGGGWRSRLRLDVRP